MTANYVLAHDLGTTGDKASLYNRHGQAVASAFIAYPTEYPRQGWAEQQPEQWWQAICQATRQLLANSQVPPVEIACVSFSGQMMGCVAVDRKGQALRSAIIWADQRATAEAGVWVERLGLWETYQVTGHRASPSYTGPKILWLRQHQPEIFREAACFLQAKDYIEARLTGRFASDYSDASGTLLYNLKGWKWSEEILEAIELDGQRLPELHASTDMVGEVLPAPAEESGLAAGTPVVIGGGDGCCAATGAGVVRPGSAYNYLGSSSWIATATHEPILDPAMRTFTFAHLAPETFSPCGTMQAAGGSYQWLRDVFCQAEKEIGGRLGLSAYELMNLQAEASPAGARNLLFLPYLLGERSPHWNPLARGSYLGLTVRHQRADIIRATLEGISFNLRMILEAFIEQGAHVEAMRVIGGGARGRVWRQILADIYGMPIQRPRLLEEATSLGAALAGGIGAGLYPGFELAEELTPIQDSTLPNPESQRVYEHLYPIFKQACQACMPLFEALAE